MGSNPLAELNAFITKQVQTHLAGLTEAASRVPRLNVSLWTVRYVIRNC